MQTNKEKLAKFTLLKQNTSKHRKKTNISITLPAFILNWFKIVKGNRSKMVEEALINFFEIKKPKDLQEFEKLKKGL